MPAAIVTLIIVLIFVAILWWAFQALWPLTGSFGSSLIGRVIYVLIVVLFACLVLFYGIAPLLHAIVGGGPYPFRF